MNLSGNNNLHHHQHFKINLSWKLEYLMRFSRKLPEIIYELLDSQAQNKLFRFMRSLYIRTVPPKTPSNSPASKRKSHMDRIRRSLQTVPLINNNIILNKKRLSQVTTQNSAKFGIGSAVNDPLSEVVIESVMTSFALFEDKYEFLDKLGQGSSGIVRRCRKRQTGQEFAVKSFVIEDEQIAWIKSNFLVMKRLVHPTIIKYEALMVDMKKRSGWLVMEYVKACSLQKAGLKTEAQIKDVMYQIFQALNYLHKEDIAHRDIKPSNILIDVQTGKIKIIDFGISKKYWRRGTYIDMWTITGTLFYRAPEMFTGGYREKVDIWAAGVLLFKLIVGKTPFQSEYHHETIKNIIEMEFELTHQFDKYSHNLKSFMFDLLQKNPQKRPNSHDCLKNSWFSSLKSNTLSRKGSVETDMMMFYQNEYKMYTPGVANFPTSFNDMQGFLEENKSILSARPYVKKVNGEEYYVIDNEWKKPN